jgi:hypothetical protein
MSLRKLAMCADSMERHVSLWQLNPLRLAASGRCLKRFVPMEAPGQVHER